MKTKKLTFTVMILVFAWALLPCHAAPEKKTPPVKKPSANQKVTPVRKGPPLGYEPAQFELPPQPYVSRLGFPKKIETTAIEANKGKLRDSVYLPKGATNVALNKPVTSSDEPPIYGSLSMVTDGNKKGIEGSWTELGPGTQWVQIDLQMPFDIHGLLLWHYFYEPRVYRDVIVQLADDASFKKNVRTVYNNDQDNSSGLGKGKDREFYENYQGEWIYFKTQRARYVRVYSRGNSSDPQNQYIEVEVWANPLPGYTEAKFDIPRGFYGSWPSRQPETTAFPPTDRIIEFYLPRDATNVALHKPVFSSDDLPIIGELPFVTDGEKQVNSPNSGKNVVVELGPGTQWVQIDLQNSYLIHGIHLWHWYYPPPRVYCDVIIQLADDADFTKNVRNVFNNDHDNSSQLGKGDDREFYESNRGQWIFIDRQTSRFVRLYSRGNSSEPQNDYIEVEVWATAAKTVTPTRNKTNSKPTHKPAAKKNSRFLLPLKKYMSAAEMAKIAYEKAGRYPIPVPLPIKTAQDAPPTGYKEAKFEVPEECNFQDDTVKRATEQGRRNGSPVDFVRRGVVYLPKGATNVARGQSVTSSDEEPRRGKLAQITDGVKKCADENYVSLAPGAQWIQINLSKPVLIHGLLLWHEAHYPYVYHDVIIQLADDADFTKNVRTVFNNDQENSSGFGAGRHREYYESFQGQWIPIEARTAQYVRFLSRGSTNGTENRYLEAEVWATPIQ